MNLNWYKTLLKPEFTPPSAIFTPAWIVLYVMIFVSILLYINAETTKNKTKGCVFFIIQLALNLSWSPIFFILHKIKLSFIVICLLLVFIIATIIEFYKVSKLAASLLMPYLVWICFAIYLNYGIMKLN